MRLEPMVETWRSFEQDENAQQLSFEEKLSLMPDRLWTWRQNLALERRLRYAKLCGNACVDFTGIRICYDWGNSPRNFEPYSRNVNGNPLTCPLFPQES